MSHSNILEKSQIQKLAREILMVDDNNVSLIPNYLQIIEQGLPERAPDGPAPKVLIIGAGIAGLVSGSLLKAAGYEIQIIEANDDRIGGRVKTFHNTGKGKAPFADKNQYAEAGAMRIPQPDKHPLVHAYLSKLGLDPLKRLFYNVDVNKETGEKEFNTWLKCNGEQLRKVDYYKPNAPSLGFPMDCEEGKSSSDLLDAALNPLKAKVDITAQMNEMLNDPQAYLNTPLDVQSQIDGWAEIISDYGNFSMRRFLNEHIDYSEGVMDAIGTLENLTSRMSYSFIQSFIETTYINSETQFYELDGGSWQLPYAFIEQGLVDESDIYMNNRVTELGWQNEQTGESHDKAVFNGRAGVYLKTINEPAEKRGNLNQHHTDIEREFTGDFVICTIPFTALRHVIVEPQFSYKKRRAIMELHYDAATKVLLEFSERFWEWDEATWQQKVGTPYRGHNSLGGGSVTDNANRFCYFPSHKVAGSNGGVILSSYSWADDARRWDSIPDEKRYQFALEGLTDMYGKEILQFFTGVGQTQSWMENYYAMGEAAIFYPGQLEYLHPNIPGAEGRVHFAGEHTSLKHAWIEGAIESGIRTALEIQQAVNGGKL